MKRLHYIFLILTILWMVVIFMFSAQNGSTSSSTSSRLSGFIISIFIPDFEEYDTATQNDITETITFIIRKGAHFTEYAILGFLSFFTVITHIWNKANDSGRYKELFRLWRFKSAISCLVFSCLYAVSDEFHQGFVADRSPALMDVCIDTCGGLSGILFACIICMLYLRRK